jgi:altronate hydrolase
MVLVKNIYNALKINTSDNVAVALKDISQNESFMDVKLVQNVSRGHKFAISPIKKNENIIKYGYAIGHATMDIEVGEHIHTHNLKTNLKGILNYEYSPKLVEKNVSKKGTFMGYKRKDDKVGIRNEIWIINTVGCVNKVAEKIAKESNILFDGKTDGIFTFAHPFGCSQLGEDHVQTQRILANMVNHPNAAGVLVLGLGCENNNIPEFKKVIGHYDENRVKFLISQQSEDEIEDGVKLISEIVSYAEKFQREEIDIAKLVIGLKCGGSDGFSGITANPLVGSLSDKIIQYGGTSILTEVPEMFGAETILMNRCETKAIFNKTVNLINDFKEYFIRYDQEIYENPSPGNKDGGISTLEDKSLGCTQKGGTSNISDVLDYGETVVTTGLNLLKGPGNDTVAITNLMSSGAHIVLFTTGRGTPIGGPIPTVKISTNSELANRKKSWIDFNAGVLLENTSMEDLTDEFFNYILGVASGTIRTKNEINEYKEISIFKDGVTL